MDNILLQKQLNDLINLLETTFEVLSNIEIKDKDSQANDNLILHETLESIKKEIGRMKKLIIELQNSRPINEQYSKFLISRINSINNLCKYISQHANSRPSFAIVISHCSELIHAIGDDEVFNLVSQFKYGDSHYVLFGKNGAGKTTLLDKLAKQVFVAGTIAIPAARMPNYSNDTMYSDKNVTLSNAINSNGYPSGQSLFLLSKLVVAKEIEQRRNYVEEKNIITNRICSVFNSLGLERNLSIDSNGNLTLSTPEIKPYSLQFGSDGEKTAIFFIMVTLLANDNPFIFIDEPENHLNGSLLRKLFDVLESERKDAKFIYATHNISFIETRKNAELVYLEKTNKFKSWNYKRFDNYDELPLDCILQVEGTDDDVLFCEGDSESSIDAKFYHILFTNYHIVPSGGCDKVYSNTLFVNNNAHSLRKNAIGIVDSDFKDNTDINKLKNNDIRVLKYNEVENCFLLERCLEKMISHMHLNKSVEQVKNDIIKEIKNKGNDIKKDFATKLFRRILFKNKIKNIEDIEAEIDSIQGENKSLFLDKYQLFCLQFDKAIENNNYPELMRLVPGKMIINNVAELLGLNGKSVYVQILIDCLSEDVSFVEEIKVDLFH